MTEFHELESQLIGRPAKGPPPDAIDPDRAARLSGRVAALPAAEGIALLAREFRGRIGLVSSFGIESAVLLHLVAQVDRAMPVLFLDTGKLFAETLRHRDRLVRLLGLGDVRSIQPDPAEVARRDPAGALWSTDADGCCAMRKVAPLAAALDGFDIWITGRKRFQGGLRSDLPLVEATEDGRLRANPLARWDVRQLEAYRRAHDLPRHELVEAGYASLGCAPCTSPVGAGEDARAGRWRGAGKTECGIHLPGLARRKKAEGEPPARDSPGGPGWVA